MGPLNIVFAILLFISAIFLIVAVLMQTGKSKGAGVVTGGSSETYFGKNKGKSRDKQLAMLTTIVAIVFVVIAILTFVFQDYVEVTGSSSSSTTASSNGGEAIDSSVTDSSATDVSSDTEDVVDESNDTADVEDAN